MRTQNNQASQRASINAAIEAVRAQGNEPLASQLERDLKAIDDGLEKGRLSNYVDGIMNRISAVNPMRALATLAIGGTAATTGFSFVTGVPFDVPNPFDTMTNAINAAKASSAFGPEHAALDIGVGVIASAGELAVAGALFWVAYLAGDNFVEHTFKKADAKAAA